MNNFETVPFEEIKLGDFIAGQKRYAVVTVPQEGVVIELYPDESYIEVLNITNGVLSVVSPMTSNTFKRFDVETLTPAYKQFVLKTRKDRNYQ